MMVGFGSDEVYGSDVWCNCIDQGRSQDFRKEGAKMLIDCAPKLRIGSHARQLNRVGLVIHVAR